MVDAGNTPLDLQDVAVEAEFRLSCDCASGSTNACDRMGLAGRFQHNTDHVKAYLESSGSGCFFRLNGQGIDSSATRERDPRSPYIGVPETRLA